MEYALLAQAGPSFPDVLAALNTAPARRPSREPGVGLVAVGSPADLVVLDADPAVDIRPLARVRYTTRGGRIILRERQVSDPRRGDCRPPPDIVTALRS